MHEVRDAEGRSAADHLRARYGAAVQVPELDLPAGLSEADTVGVVYDEVEGNYFWADFGVLQETFADPALAARRRYREAVLGYLELPTISPLAFWFERPVLPSVTPISRALSDHQSAPRPSRGGKRR
jgi:hypothetical protein